MRVLNEKGWAVAACGATLMATAITGSATAANASDAPTYEVSVVGSGLDAPTGIAVRGFGPFTKIYFTEVPTPGVPGSEGGMNGVKQLRLFDGRITTLSEGEPEPVNLATGPFGSLYWTCRTAGVILTRDYHGDISLVLNELERPTGIDVDRHGTVYFTQVPTPGVPGSQGGTNNVARYDGDDVEILSMGEPEPADVVVSRDGVAYWTCRTAGVIVRQTPAGERTVLLRGLNKPVGITLDWRGRTLYFTEVPTPGVPGRAGGGNFVWRVDLETLGRTIVHFGDPEPTDVAVDLFGNVYWTCTTAGVIVQAKPRHRYVTSSDDEKIPADILAEELLEDALDDAIVPGNAR